MRVRSAILPDATAVWRLIDAHVADGTLLPRALPEICENIRDFVVAEHAGTVVGCAALHLYGPHLAEIRSVAVSPDFRGRGAGRRLVAALLREAERQRAACVCLFTRIPDYFSALGFSAVKGHVLPDKVYKDCQLCPRRHACDEITMVRGEVPQTIAAAEAWPSRRAVLRTGS